MGLSGLLRPSFLFQLSKGKHLQVTEQLLIEYFVRFGSCVLGKEAWGVPRHILFTFIPVSLYVYVCTNKSFSVLLQMVDWMFKKALAAIQSPPSIPFTTLLSTDGLRLGDICFAKIQMNLCMWTIAIAVLEEWISNGSFNPDYKPDEDHSHTTAILLVLTPNMQGTVLTYASIGLIVRWRMGPVGWIEDIPKLITFICSQLREIGSPHQMLVRCIA